MYQTTACSPAHHQWPVTRRTEDILPNRRRWSSSGSSHHRRFNQALGRLTWTTVPRSRSLPTTLKIVLPACTTQPCLRREAHHRHRIRVPARATNPALSHRRCHRVRVRVPRRLIQDSKARAQGRIKACNSITPSLSLNSTAPGRITSCLLCEWMGSFVSSLEQERRGKGDNFAFSDCDHIGIIPGDLWIALSHLDILQRWSNRHCSRIYLTCIDLYRLNCKSQSAQYES